MEISLKILEKAGFKDLTGGWGGSQGQDYIYRLRKKPIDITIRTVDFDNRWHLDSNFKITFETMEELNHYCIQNFGKAILPSVASA